MIHCQRHNGPKALSTLTHSAPLGKDPATKSDEFLEKCQRGGRGVIFNQKISLADFGNFKQGSLSMFRVCFFNNGIDIIN